MRRDPLSLKNYPGGYTSYGSAHRLQAVSPTFESLRRKLKRHVAAFAAAVEWDLQGRELEMTDCWVNIMPQHTVHSLHLHPHSTLSGTYYVQVPRGSPGTKFEDPRLDRFMAAPPRKTAAKREARPWVYLSGGSRTIAAVRKLAASRGRAQLRPRRSESA